MLSLGKTLSEWGLFVMEVGEGDSTLEPPRSKVSYNSRLTTHLATSSETDTDFLRETALRSGLLLA